MDILSKFEEDGYAVVENYLSQDEVDELKAAGEDLTKNLPPENERRVFSTVELQQDKDPHYLDSAHKISYFFETGALEEDGKLKVDPAISLNKVAQALHLKHPLFKKISFDERAKKIASQLKFQEPAVCQSMYIYKNPGTGTEVVEHQDATYLYTEPSGLFGFWIALDDATVENGCLWMAPGSHKNGVHRRYLRNKDPNSATLLVYDKPPRNYPKTDFRPVPVKRGTCVLIHGKVIHFSEANKSQNSRHAYAYHVIETKGVDYFKDNWLQPEAEGFPLLYKN